MLFCMGLLQVEAFSLVMDSNTTTQEEQLEMGPMYNSYLQES